MFPLLLLILIFPAVSLADDASLPEFEDLYFRGYKCTQDCSGHIAGYNWAIENGLTGPHECGGRSNSFIEGCTSLFVESNPENVTLVSLKRSSNYAVGCIGSDLYGGPCYDGYGGPLYDGYGGPLYDGYGGPLYDGYGGNCYAGYGGNCYDGYGGDMSKCPILCQ